MNYLDAIPSMNTQTSAAGIASYIGAFPSSPCRIGGAGFATYLSSISQECDTIQPTEECAEAITDFLGAVSSGDAPPATVADGAEAIVNYLDTISRPSTSLGGSGLLGHLDSLGGESSAIVQSSAPATSSQSLQAPPLKILPELVF